MVVSSIKNASGNQLILKEDYTSLTFMPYCRIDLFDTTGNVLWGTSPYDLISGVNQLSNDNFFCTCTNFNVANNDTSACFNDTFDSVGNFLYYRKIANYYWTDNVIMHKDTAYIALGGYRDDLFLITKIAAVSGDIIWSKKYYNGAPSIISFSGCYTSEDQILFACQDQSTDPNSTFIFTINSSGDSISTLYINKFDNLIPKKIISYNNSFCFIGNINYGNDSSDIYFLKAPLDTLFVGSSPQVAVKTNRFSLSPNPAAERVTVSLNANSKEPKQIKVFRLNGTAV